MELFEIKDGMLSFSPQSLAIEPFSKIWRRDKTKNKDIAIGELSYVFYYADYKSPFSDILDDDDRSKEIIKNIILPKGWKKDKVVEDAITFYKSRNETISSKLLDDSKHAINKLSNYLRTINFEDTEYNEKTNKVTPKHDVKKIADTIKQIPAIVSALNELEEQVKRDMEHKGELKGGKSKSIFEDGKF